MKNKLTCNKAVKTPENKTKSHIVKACKNGVEKVIRFGQQGAKTSGKFKAGESKETTARRNAFKARHKKNIDKGIFSAAYWSDKVKW